MTPRNIAIAIYRDAVRRGDTRAQKKAREQAYRETHAILANPPRKSLTARVWAKIKRKTQ